MTQEYTPVAWQDETTSQQGTLINAERLNQMQTAHHYADGLEEVDAIPTADPGVSYHKIVYCTADSTIYRWDGTAWTADIDDETRRLLQQEIARATAAESELRGQLEDEHDARVDAEAAINDRITDEATELVQRIATETSTRYTADTALGTRITNETTARETADTGLGNRITAEATARADADTALGGRIDTEQARAEAAEQANAQAIANTYTKAEIDTALGAKADVATTYTKTETDALLALKADQATTYTKTETDTLLGAKANDNAVVKLTGDQTIQGVKTFTSLGFTSVRISSSRTGGATGVGGIDYYDGANHRLASIIGQTNGAILLYPNTDGIATNINAVQIQNQRAYSAGNTTDVATIGTLDAYSPMVRTTGNQSVTGDKQIPEMARLKSEFSTNSKDWKSLYKITVSQNLGTAIIEILQRGEHAYGVYQINYRAYTYSITKLYGTIAVDNVAIALKQNNTDMLVFVKGTRALADVRLSNYAWMNSFINSAIEVDTSVEELDADLVAGDTYKGVVRV